MLRVLAAALLLFARHAHAQSFEVASVKPVRQGAPGNDPLRGGPGTDSPGWLGGVATMKALLMQAYGLKSYQIGGPPWLESERYRITARVPAGAEQRQIPLMLQALLAERFGLRAHLETRELAVYDLTIGKNGMKLAESTGVDGATRTKSAPPGITTGADGLPAIPPGVSPARSYFVVVGGPDGVLCKLWARRETMARFADRLSGQLNRPVLDMTDLKGRYDFTLAWTIESTGGTVPRTNPPPDEIDFHDSPVLSDPGLSIFTAVQTRLGLRLEQKKRPLEMLIVDGIDRTPTGN
jgi:uncharacterized protein (TIGR03435 family)